MRQPAFRSISPSLSPAPSMDRPSPDGSSNRGSPLPPWPKSRSSSPKNNVEVTVIELASNSPSAPPPSLTHQQSASSPPSSPSIPATPDRHVSVIVVGNHHDYKVQDSSSIGSPSPHIIDHEPNQTKTPTGESLSPPPGFESSREEGSSLSSGSDDGRKSVNSKKSGTSLMIEGSVATKIFEDSGGML